MRLSSQRRHTKASLSCVPASCGKGTSRSYCPCGEHLACLVWMANGNFPEGRSNSGKHRSKLSFARYEKNWVLELSPEDYCHICTLIDGSMSTQSSMSFLRATSARWKTRARMPTRKTLPGTREFVSLAARNDWFDKLYIEFEFVDSSANASKRFAVATQSTLFSKYGLIKYWGRVGVKPRTKWQEFGSPRELDKQIFETAKRCLADGY